MSTATDFPDGFFLPKTESKAYLDALCVAIQNSPEWIQDDIDDLNATITELAASLEKAQLGLAERRDALATAYAKPENNRRKPQEDTNVSMFEHYCRLVEPTCVFVFEEERCWIDWENGGTLPRFSAQAAWRAAFALLDRRQKSEVPNE